MAESGAGKMRKVLKALQMQVIRRGDPNLSYDMIERIFKRETDLQDSDKIFAMIQDMTYFGYLIGLRSVDDPTGAVISKRKFQIGEEGLILMSENQEKIA